MSKKATTITSAKTSNFWMNVSFIALPRDFGVAAGIETTGLL
jgi:hypothetical protein